jgi:DNA-binding NarL/FixJ family response regulator
MRTHSIGGPAGGGCAYHRSALPAGDTGSPRVRATIQCLELPRPFTVVLAEDQRAYRDGLARAIAQHGRLELVAVAARGDEAFRAIESLQPDVALIDVRMGGMRGPNLCELLRERHPHLPTLLVLMSADGTSAVESEPGVDAFVAKDRSRREICEALVQLAQRSRMLTTG